MNLKYFDWYDYESVEKLQEERAKKYMDFVKKWHKAKEKGDEEAMQKDFKALSKHKNEDKILKEKANEHHYYWY